MKKKYSKPEIVFESFTLSTNIAGDCSVPTSTPNQGSCAYTVETKYGTWHVFTDAVAACGTSDGSLDQLEDGIYNGICYNVPYDESTLFNS